MDTSASNRRLRTLLTAIGNETLIPQPDFQRRLVWTNKDKVEFIRTVLEGYPFPEIYIAAGKVNPKTGEGAEVLVDGQQRITTLYQYFRGSPDIKLGANIDAYSELSESEQLKFLEYSVVVRDMGNMEMGKIKEVFKRINSTSYGLNAMELHNSRFGGLLKQFAEEVSLHPIFDEKKIFTSTDIKRMNDVKFCLGLIVTTMSTYFTRDKDLEEYLENYNEEFPDKDKIDGEFKVVFESIESLNLASDSRAFKKADFFTLFIEMHRVLIKEGKAIDYIDLSIKLSGFYECVNHAAAGLDRTNKKADEYYRSALQGSNDRANRITRGKLIREIISSASS
ncbi:MAG: DUF262 domain-containing protein [Gammaproteobacteria bacterium]|nr:DUF262 domain-containing protein [Gammaproteobacteria bacterium]MBR9798143.1 DUF262 domain-containing protein [Gammaproteobacteria bacterium]